MAYLRYVGSLVFGFLLAWVIFLLALFYQMGAPTESSRWIYEIYNIKFSIANSIKTPKLVIVAGSNALFGISCKIIEQQTRVPCVNGGTHAGLGLDYILSSAHFLVKPGDIVLLPFEYELYQDNKSLSEELIDYVFSRDPNYLLSVDFLTQFNFFTGISFQRMRLGINSKLNFPKPITKGYQSKTLNDYGDETSNRKATMTETQVQIINSLSPIKIEKNMMSIYTKKKIHDFIFWCKDKNIKVIVTWPNTLWFEDYKEPTKQENFKNIEDFYTKIKIPMLGKPEDFMYDQSMFFDTIYHLNDRGVRYRSQQLIELLQPYLEGIKNSGSS